MLSRCRYQGVSEEKIPNAIQKISKGQYVIWSYSNFRTPPDEADSCTRGCGNYTGESEKKIRLNDDGTTRPHYGEDILSDPGFLVLSPVEGTIMQHDIPYSSYATGDKLNLNRVSIDFGYIPTGETPAQQAYFNASPEYGYASFMYVDSKSYINFTKGTSTVEVGSIIGESQDLHANGYSKNTDNHVHAQIGFNKDKPDINLHYISPDPKNFIQFNEASKQIDEQYQPLKQLDTDVNNFNNRNNK